MYTVGYGIVDIKDLTYSDATFQKGLQLFERGAIPDFSRDKAGLSFYGEVKGT